MSRRLRLLLPVAAAALGVALALPAPALPEGYLPPVLLPGLTPRDVDDFGFSPDGDFFVFQVGNEIRFRRLADNTVTYRQRVVDETLVGFDPSDQRAFLLERVGPNASRLRFADPDTGEVLIDRVASGTPAVFTNWDAGLNVFLESLPGNRTRALVVRASGKIVHQRTMAADSGVFFNLNDPAVVFTEAQQDGETRLDVINRKGNLTLRESLAATDVAGFEPDGPALVVSRSTGPSAFRVKLVHAANGRILLNRNFAGPQSLGFAPNGDLLGVDATVVGQPRTLFFRTNTGAQVFP